MAALDSSLTTTESQYQRLRDDIVAGTLAPGTLLLETAIAGHYGVGRGPVREAILRLEFDRLVVRGARGAQVRSLTADEVVDIYQARIALESEAAAAAARHHSALDLARLQHVHERSVAAEDTAEKHALHGLWHKVLRQSCGNPTIDQHLEQLTLQLALHDSDSMSSDPTSQTNDEHAAVVTAIVEGDEHGARELLRSHLERTRDMRIAAMARSVIADRPVT